MEADNTSRVCVTSTVNTGKLKQVQFKSVHFYFSVTFSTLLFSSSLELFLDTLCCPPAWEIFVRMLFLIKVSGIDKLVYIFFCQRHFQQLYSFLSASVKLQAEMGVIFT